MVAHPALILPEAAVESFDESFLNVDSTPASTCLVDGRNLGKTPRFHVSVRPGSHAVSCVDIEHGMSKTTSVTLGAGETKSILVKLDWIALRR
jgi:serine/threonine-protein kinase